MPKITPFLWFDGRVEEAVAFYAGIFADARVSRVDAMSAEIELAGQPLMLFNGGPRFRFTEAVSLFVGCETQAEVDFYWSRLADGGSESRCGWLQDRFGLWWQVIPAVLGRYLMDPDRAKAQRVTAAMLTMSKIDIAALDAAHAR